MRVTNEWLDKFCDRVSHQNSAINFCNPDARVKDNQAPSTSTSESDPTFIAAAATLFSQIHSSGRGNPVWNTCICIIIWSHAHTEKFIIYVPFRILFHGLAKKSRPNWGLNPRPLECPKSTFLRKSNPASNGLLFGLSLGSRSVEVSYSWIPDQCQRWRPKNEIQVTNR